MNSTLPTLGQVVASTLTAAVVSAFCTAVKAVARRTLKNAYRNAIPQNETTSVKPPVESEIEHKNNLQNNSRC
ncbi:MAG TPA: hypothetical protein IAA58_10780 [Candidatus Gallacutalibacter stercoravium]|nr:hypothetical protein [Candidatus Gallacutalibacter stercoravium]